MRAAGLVLLGAAFGLLAAWIPAEIAWRLVRLPGV